ncbi:MAG: hypothetical protein U0X39_10410 [Bacteroidales bacterium]
MRTLKSRKMKRSAYKTGMLLLVAASLLSLSITAQEVSKEFHKEYNADKNSTLDVSNKYGDVVVTAWDKDQVVIDVIVKVDVPGQDKAERLLGMIDVQFSEGNGKINARTLIDDKFNFSGWGSNKRFSIDYTIKMPYQTALLLMNRYGDIDIDELRGQVSLDAKYGNISVDKLTRGNEKPINRIAVSYGKASISQAGWLDLYARYSGSFEVEESQALLIDTRYSTFRIGTTSSIVCDSKYDKFSVEKVNNLVLETGYTTTNIGELLKKLSVEGSYGSLTVESVPKGFESIEVDVRYMGVRVGMSEDASYRLDGRTSYGDIKFNDDDFKFERRIVENNSSEIAGLVGRDEKTDSKVRISSSYASVKLY